jgi:hypothetical protein
MIRYVTVSNRIFGILVDGYMSAINAYRKKSDERGKRGDVSLAPFFDLDSNYDYVSKAISVKFTCGSFIQNPQCRKTLYPHTFAQGSKKARTKPSVRPSTTFWDQSYVLAVQSQEFFVEAYERFVTKDFDSGGSKAMAGLDLLLQRYVSSSSWELRLRSRSITASEKSTRRGILMRTMTPP